MRPARGTGRRGMCAVVSATALLLALAGPAAAGDYRTGDAVTIGAGETVSDDLYVAGQTVTIEGTVDGDVTVAAGTVAVRGQVNGSLNVGGGTVDVPGSVQGALRAMGGTVRIGGSVGRDVVVSGGTVTIDSGATVTGDVAGGAGTLTIAGAVAGDVYVGAGTLEVTGRVEGMLDVSVGSLTIGPQAVIVGEVTYTSSREAAIASGAQTGTVTRRDPPAVSSAPFLDNPIVSYLGALLGLLVLGWGLLWIRPHVVTGPGVELRRNPVLSLGAGLATWIGQFLLCIALIILGALVGILAGALAGAFLLPAFIVALLIVIGVLISQVPIAMAVGDLVRRRDDPTPYLAYAMGAAIVAAVLVIAGVLHAAVGGLVFLVAWIVGLGAYTLHLWRTRRTAVVVTAPPAAPVPPGAADANAAPPPA
jgi:cytoskeletal protein CcmA (bactofilin family)